jgi:hypothetical protein
MRTSTIALFIIVGSACYSFAQESETKQFTSAYNVSISTPKDWVWDSEAVRDAKVSITEMMFKIKTDGKIRLLNTGLPTKSPEGYCRIRLSILSNAKLSQKETRDLSDADLEELAKGAREELTNMPMFTVDKDSVAVTKTRADTDYWAYRISYTRTGTNGPVRVEQYYVPFSNRAVSLTLSYELAHKEKLAAILLRVWTSLDLNDDVLWPKER